MPAIRNTRYGLYSSQRITTFSKKMIFPTDSATMQYGFPNRCHCTLCFIFPYLGDGLITAVHKMAILVDGISIQCAFTPALTTCRALELAAGCFGQCARIQQD